MMMMMGAGTPPETSIAAQHKINSLLEDNPTLEELLDVAGVVGEARKNWEFSQYLGRSDVLTKLIDFMLTPFTANDEIECREVFMTTGSTEDLPNIYKYPFLSADIVAQDIPPIVNELGSNKALWEKLFQFLFLPVINTWLAFRLTECIHRLFVKSPGEILEFIKQQQDDEGKAMVKMLVKHIERPPLGDLLGLLLGGMCNDDDDRVPIDTANWWIEHNLVDEIFAMFEPGSSADGMIAGCRFLTDLLRRYGFQRIKPYIEKLIEPSITQRMIDLMIEAEKLDSGSVMFQEGMGYLITLVDKLYPIVYYSIHPELMKLQFASKEKPEENFQPDEQLHEKMQPIYDALPEFIRILNNPGPLKPVPVSWSEEPLDPPLGPARLKITELVSTIVKVWINHEVAINAVLSSNILQPILNLMPKYDMNNILHVTIDDIVQSVQGERVSEDEMGTQDKYLGMAARREESPHLQLQRQRIYRHLVEQCNICDLIVRCDEENEAQIAAGKHAKGYVGILTSMTTVLVTCGPEVPIATEGWYAYVMGRYKERVDTLNFQWPTIERDSRSTWAAELESATSGGNQLYESNEDKTQKPDDWISSSITDQPEGAGPQSKYLFCNSTPVGRYHDALASEKTGEEVEKECFGDFDLGGFLGADIQYLMENDDWVAKSGNQEPPGASESRADEPPDSSAIADEVNNQQGTGNGNPSAPPADTSETSPQMPPLLPPQPNTDDAASYNYHNFWKLDLPDSDEDFGEG